MLKVHVGGEKDGRPVHIVLLGLSYKNLERLKEGRPIDMDGTTVGLPEGTRIVIMAGETEQSMAREFAELVGPETKISIDPRLRD